MDCKRCQWQWASKAPERVKVCPKCRSPYFDRERKQARLQDKQIDAEDINKEGATC